MRPESAEHYVSKLREVGQGHTTKISSRTLTNVHLTAYPSFSYFCSAVRPSIMMRVSRMRPLTGDAEEEASWEASGVNEWDQRAILPGGI
jgi:hypothetical protein